VTTVIVTTDLQSTVVIFATYCQHRHIKGTYYITIASVHIWVQTLTSI